MSSGTKILTKTATYYDIYDFGYDTYLVKTDSFYDDTSIKDKTTETVSPIYIGSGELTGNQVVTDGYIKSDNYELGVSGWYLGPDSAQLPATFIIGDLTSSNYSSVVPYAGYKLEYATGNGYFNHIEIRGGSNSFFISDTLDTSAKAILKDFTFGSTDYSGAFKTGDITWNTTTGALTGGTGILINKSGIIGAKTVLGVTTATFTLDTSTGDATFAGTLSAAAGTLGTITSGSIYSGIFSTAPSASTTQRIIMSQASNNLKFYDEDNNNTITIGNYGANPLLEIALSDNTHEAISVTGSSDATSYGFSFENSNDRASVGLNISLTSTNAANNLEAINVSHSGSGALFYGTVNGSGRGVSIIRASDKTGTDYLLRLQSENNTSGASVAHFIQSGISNVTSSCVKIESSTKGKALEVSVDNANSSNPAGYFTHNSVNVGSLQANKSVGGACLMATVTANDGYRCYGLEFNIANAGAGAEYAFHFQGSEYASASSVSTVIGVIKVYTPDGSTGYVPVYSSAS